MRVTLSWAMPSPVLALMALSTGKGMRSAERALAVHLPGLHSSHQLSRGCLLSALAVATLQGQLHCPTDEVHLTEARALSNCQNAVYIASSAACTGSGFFQEVCCIPHFLPARHCLPDIHCSCQCCCPHLTA